MSDDSTPDVVGSALHGEKVGGDLTADLSSVQHSVIKGYEPLVADVERIMERISVAGYLVHRCEGRHSNEVILVGDNVVQGGSSMIDMVLEKAAAELHAAAAEVEVQRLAMLGWRRIQDDPPGSYG